MSLAESRSFKVIEGRAQAYGATCKGRSVGSIGHNGVWSSCQDKIKTTGGEGGMVTTNDEALWSSMWAYKDHGKSCDAVYNREHAPGFWWLHESFGINWRMTELQGVPGRIQTVRMPDLHRQRVVNAEQIREACHSIPWLRVPTQNIHRSCNGRSNRAESHLTPSGWILLLIYANVVNHQRSRN